MNLGGGAVEQALNLGGSPPSRALRDALRVQARCDGVQACRSDRLQHP